MAVQVRRSPLRCSCLPAASAEAVISRHVKLVTQSDTLSDLLVRAGHRPCHVHRHSGSSVFTLTPQPHPWADSPSPACSQGERWPDSVLSPRLPHNPGGPPLPHQEAPSPLSLWPLPLIQGALIIPCWAVSIRRPVWLGSCHGGAHWPARQTDRQTDTDNRRCCGEGCSGRELTWSDPTRDREGFLEQVERQLLALPCGSPDAAGVPCPVLCLLHRPLPAAPSLPPELLGGSWSLSAGGVQASSCVQARPSRAAFPCASPPVPEAELGLSRLRASAQVSFLHGTPPPCRSSPCPPPPPPHWVDTRQTWLQSHLFGETAPPL